MESYSLGLHAPHDPDRLNGLLDEGASHTEWRDAVEEGIMLGWTSTESLWDEYLELWEASGVDCMFINAGEESNAPLTLMKRLSRYVHLCDQRGECLDKGVTADGILRAKELGKKSLVLATNGIPLAGNHLSVQDEMQYIRCFSQFGARMMHLTYNRRNAIGDGCGEPVDGGLSEFGTHVVKEMNRLGVIIDLAHTGWKTCIDAARASAQPVVASHTAAWALHQNVRCKPDEVIKAIVDTGGPIGITNVPGFLGRTGDIRAFLDHIDYVVKHFGSDAVTIGTDMPYVSVRTQTSDADIRPYAKRRTKWESLWPGNARPSSPPWNKPEMTMSMVWTNWPLFTVGLVQRGYDDEQIRAILGGNLLRVAKAVWGK